MKAEILSHSSTSYLSQTRKKREYNTRIMHCSFEDQVVRLRNNFLVDQVVSGNGN